MMTGQPGPPVNQSAATGWSATQEKKMEKAPLMKSHEDRYKPKEAEMYGNYWRVIFGWVKFSLCPGLLFSFTSIVFMLGYHSCPRFLIGLFSLFVLILLVNAYTLFERSLREQKRLDRLQLEQEQSRQKGQPMKVSPEEKALVVQKSRSRKFSVSLGFCAVALVLGGTVGTSIHLQKLTGYWSFNNRRHYTNVAPDEPAAAHTDASVLVFMEGARPDATRVMGYRRHGHVYCAAPVDVDASHSSENPLTDIQYWAVGKDCCDKGFTCDDSSNNKARSGLVLSKKTGMDSIMTGVLSEDDVHYYEEAVKMGLSKFDITSPEERLFVRYSADIEQAQETHYSEAWWYWWYCQLGFMPLWMTAGLMTILVGYGEYKDHIGDVKESVLYNANHCI